MKNVLPAKEPTLVSSKPIEKRVDSILLALPHLLVSGSFRRSCKAHADENFGITRLSSGFGKKKLKSVDSGSLERDLMTGGSKSVLKTDLGSLWIFGCCFGAFVVVGFLVGSVFEISCRVIW